MTNTVDIVPGLPIRKDPNEKKLVTFNWDAYGLAAGASIATSTWTITAEHPTGESPVALESDNESIVSGDRKTQARVTGGTLGTRYRVTNHVVTDESPVQEKEESIFVDCVNK